MASRLRMSIELAQHIPVLHTCVYSWYVITYIITHNTGWTLLHTACDQVENVNLLKFLLSQAVCQPMLLAKWGERELLPLDVAKLQEVCVYQETLKGSSLSIKFFGTISLRHSGPACC